MYLLNLGPNLFFKHEFMAVNLIQSSARSATLACKLLFLLGSSCVLRFWLCLHLFVFGGSILRNFAQDNKNSQVTKANQKSFLLGCHSPFLCGLLLSLKRNKKIMQYICREGKSKRRTLVDKKRLRVYHMILPQWHVNNKQATTNCKLNFNKKWKKNEGNLITFSMAQFWHHGYLWTPRDLADVLELFRSDYKPKKKNL